jgi:hypothetical protein
MNLDVNLSFFRSKSSLESESERGHRRERERRLSVSHLDLQLSLWVPDDPAWLGRKYECELESVGHGSCSYI